LEVIVMPNEQIHQLRTLEGRHVSLALRDGSRIDDCQLVLVGRARVRSVWIFTQGLDMFLSLNDLIDFWETQPTGAHRAA
jgi:hypothetical protein